MTVPFKNRKQDGTLNRNDTNKKVKGQYELVRHRTGDKFEYPTVLLIISIDPNQPDAHLTLFNDTVE